MASNNFKSSFAKKEVTNTSPAKGSGFAALSGNAGSLQSSDMLQNGLSSMAFNNLTANVSTESLRNISLSSIRSFKDHPFKVLDNSDMEDLISSINENGFITPIIVRAVGLGEYECISGHRRVHAASKLGLVTVPAVVKQLSDDEAIIAMVDANKQRETILPSERAFSLKMKLDAMMRMDKSNIQGDVDSRSLVAEEEGLTRTQVYRFIRLTSLHPQLLEKVDSGELVFNVAYEIAAYCENSQQAVLDYLNKGNSIKLKDLPILQKYKDDKTVTCDDLEAALKKTKIPKEGVTLSPKVASQYFPPNYTKKERMKVIISLLEKWREENFPNIE